MTANDFIPLTRWDKKKRGWVDDAVFKYECLLYKSEDLSLDPIQKARVGGSTHL